MNAVLGIRPCRFGLCGGSFFDPGLDGTHSDPTLIDSFTILSVTQVSPIFLRALKLQN
jgi:hypothetical protein